MAEFSYVVCFIAMGTGNVLLDKTQTGSQVGNFRDWSQKIRFVITQGS